MLPTRANALGPVASYHRVVSRLTRVPNTRALPWGYRHDPSARQTPTIGDEVVEVSTRTGDSAGGGSGPGPGTVGGNRDGGARSSRGRNEGDAVRKSSCKWKIRVLNKDVDTEGDPSIRRTRSRERTGGPRKKLKTGEEGMTELKETLQNIDKA